MQIDDLFQLIEDKLTEIYGPDDKRVPTDDEEIYASKLKHLREIALTVKYSDTLDDIIESYRDEEGVIHYSFDFDCE